VSGACLHDQSVERDACGVGFVADRAGRPSRAVLDLVLAGLAGVDHRGAVAADGRTGDGAGVLVPIPAGLLPAPWCGLAMVFLRDESARGRIEDACRAEGLEPRGWRPVPVEPSALGDGARGTMPAVEQLVLRRPLGLALDDAERIAHRARRRIQGIPGVYVASLSFRTVTYKALCAATQLAAFYPDLRDPAFAVPFGIFHQRFSTNTEPSWERAQPFRMLCHNGEINTLAGNVAGLRARRSELGDVDESGSDSSILDEAVELIVRGGRDIRHALAMLVPAAWETADVDEDVRAFRRYHAGLVAPWDGPAAIVFTDGRVVGAALDRNGLRPLRWAVAGDLVACASEAGAIPLPAGAAVRRGRVGPGEIVAVDPAGAGFEESEAIVRRLARRRPYRRWTAAREPVAAGEPLPPPADDLTHRHVAAGYTREEISLVLRPVAAQGHEPVSSMGDDTALPPLAGRGRPLSSYLRQRFAQVTNPPIDHLRERGGMSLATLLGPRAPLLSELPEAARLLELESFLLFPSALAALDPVPLDATFDGAEGLRGACLRLRGEAVHAVAGGAALLRLTDAGPRAAVPPALAVGIVDAALIEAGLRTRASILVDSDEPRSSHDCAVLLAYGADAICPRLAFETVAALAASDGVGGDRPSPAEAQLRLKAALEEGVLKTLSRLGISDVASYRGARLVEAIGLDRDLIDLCLRGTPSPVGGVGFAELEVEALARAAPGAPLENPGYVKFRKGGEPHATSPDVVAAAHALRGATRSDRADLYERFASLVDGRAPMELRDLVEPVAAAPPVPLEQVEPVESILRRFSGGAMSHGSLSAEAHETIAVALNRLGGRSNSGEGGEDPARFRTERNSRIKQIASARFGVTPEYAMFADELQIKIAQGSKPGEGGQLPAHKVTPEIARLRHTEPGIPLISPPPHHDIYSIEDLAQLVFDLRQVNPAADVSVKLVAQTGVGLVAVGVAKALADVVHVAGADGGTGASPLASIKNAGMPWELGLAEAQQALVGSGLRGRVRLRADGGLKTGRDVLVAALFGADEVSFGTALLIAEGCLLVRSCHLDTCPVGIATQRPELRAKYGGTPEMVESYLRHVAEDVRRRLAALGLRSWSEAVGRTDLLRRRPQASTRAASFELGALLAPAPGGYAAEPQLRGDGAGLGERLARDAAAALDEARIVELSYAIGNGDRTVGARLGGLVGARYGSSPPPGRVRARFEGSAGQSFGAFLAAGVELALTGEANDGVGKSMSGGRIAIRPPAGDLGDPVLLGNAALYGATGGELYCAGAAGERFAVRNSGAVAVVEGAGDHLCEYMTAGTVVVLGPVGCNVAAGMTGGVLHVLGGVGEIADAGDLLELHRLLERHLRFTGSERAAELLAEWPRAAASFRTLAPAAKIRSDAAATVTV